MLGNTSETSAAVAVVVTLALTPVMRRIALANGFLDQPADRESHRTPTPYLGGVAIAGGTVAGVLVGSPDFEGAHLLIVGGVVAVSLVSLLEDHRSLNPWMRLAAQAGVAAAAASAGVRTGLGGNEALDIAVTIVWLVAITNAFNLLDNMDGLSTGVAFVASVGAAIAAVHNGQLVIGSLAAAMAGACWSFLAYNTRPASIFMATPEACSSAAAWRS